MKKIATFFVSFLLLIFSLCGCETQATSTNEEVLTTPYTGYILTPGKVCTVNDWFEYEVIHYFGDTVSVISQAEPLVRNWWNNDETFSTPEFVWITVHSGDLRGFQDPGYIFLDPNTSAEDLLATVVHEWLHELVPPSTLIDLKRDGFGRAVMEMIVEAITVDILGESNVLPTQNYLYFKETPELWNHKAELIAAFRAKEDISAYERILGENWERIVAEATIVLS